MKNIQTFAFISALLLIQPFQALPSVPDLRDLIEFQGGDPRNNTLSRAMYVVAWASCKEKLNLGDKEYHIAFVEGAKDKLTEIIPSCGHNDQAYMQGIFDRFRTNELSLLRNDVSYQLIDLKTGRTAHFLMGTKNQLEVYAVLSAAVPDFTKDTKSAMLAYMDSDNVDMEVIESIIQYVV